MNSRFVSTAIPYVNASPHLGFALELLLADVQARQAKLNGQPVYFLTGSDDNSLKNALAAEAAGLSTQAFVDQHAAQFAALTPLLNLSCNDFIATSQDARHAPAVERLWRACAANGDIYSDEYQGLYCVGCEAFLDPSELTAEQLCPDHLKAPEPVAERNYFFRLSRYQAQLQRWLSDGTLNIQPSQRRNEVLSFLQNPLRDLSISRSRERARGWGIEVPDDPSQVVYVWFDALANYISALGYAQESEPGEALTQFWHQATQIQHVIGKGVLRFHAVYWPAILHSAGLRPPTDLLVHGYITLDGQKISKSLGNTISPDEAAAYFGVEALRYYLLRHVGSVEDGNFALDRFEEVYNTELANQLGNLVNRVCALGIRHQLTPTSLPLTQQPDFPALAATVGPTLLTQVDEAITAWQPHRALAQIWQGVDAANRFISKHEPWVLAKAGNTEQLEQVLNALYQALHTIGEALGPLLPETSAKIGAALSNRTHAPTPLFPKRSEPL